MLPLLLAAAAVLPSQQQLETALMDGIAASCPGAAVSIDPDLTRAARAYAAAASTGRARVTGPAATFFASLESSEPSPVAGIATVSAPANADRAAGDLFPRHCRFNRAAIAAGVLPGGEGVVVVFTVQHATDLQRLPGRVEPGATLELAGRLGPDLANPRLYVTRPSGDVDELTLASVAGRFAGQVSLRARGEHVLEVLADGRGGPEVVAVRRVFAGAEPPSMPPPEQPVAPGLAGAAEAIAQLRAGRGLPKLTRDPELDAVAEAHSAEMARLQKFAHVLPTDGALADRLKKRGYAYRSAGENIGLSDSIASAHEAIVGSPAHLANLLDPRHRRFGLGAVEGPTPDGARGFYLTEVLAAPVVGSADPAGEAAKLLASDRRRRGLPALHRDAALDAAAQREVRAAALADRLQIGDAAGRVLDAVPELEQAVAELYVGSAPDELTASKNNAEPRWTRLGVGCLYASSKTMGSGRLWTVLIFAR